MTDVVFECHCEPTEGRRGNLIVELFMKRCTSLKMHRQKWRRFLKMLFECNKRLISFRLIHLPFEFCFTPIYNKHLRFKHCERQIVVNLEASKVNDRIVVDPNICHGQASIRGTRIPVHQIVSMPANGDNIEELFKEYPSIERENILACLSYAASLAEKQITPIGG